LRPFSTGMYGWVFCAKSWQLRKLNEVIETLVTREGYCAECANELLKYVSSLLAREK
jgi:predicted Ser/Thr protein kinase